MNLNLLKSEVQQYIKEHLTKDVTKIVLKKSPFPGCTSQEIAAQIEAKSAIKKKLPTWFNTKGIYFANKLNLSQTSSESTANYKATLVQGETLLDLTAGFGVDSFAFSKNIKQIWHLEKNTALSKIAEHNFNILKVTNIKVIPENGLAFLRTSNLVFDCIYLDPSRRNEAKKKVFFLSDCEPDVTEHLEFLFTKSDHILIKTGPLLDIKAGLGQLRYVKTIHVIALDNEVKEIIWALEKGFSGKPIIKTVNLGKYKSDTFTFKQHEEKEAIADFSLPLNYLYEPNAAILKSGAYKLIGNRFGFHKIGQHSHLYTSKNLKDFPGRRFKILEILAYNKNVLKQIRATKANVTVRNFPESVSSIRKRLKLKDGGENYLFFTKDLNNKSVVIQCVKVPNIKSK
ncbi:class I SAM-dependent methyltransferase [Maribacter sp. R77961]|uniref:class I SAM-dependent methyltransferase n=1 Tax=Maribacter sp. R77961 TaxID=3093871 RepID=UPI0037C51F61